MPTPSKKRKSTTESATASARRAATEEQQPRRRRLEQVARDDDSSPSDDDDDDDSSQPDTEGEPVDEDDEDTWSNDEEEEPYEEEEEEEDDRDGEDTASDDDDVGDSDDENLGPDPIHVTVQLDGNDASHFIHFRNDITIQEFRTAIANKCGLPPASKFIISRKRKSKPPQQIMNKKHFDYMVDSYFDHDDQYLRILVTPANPNDLSASSSATTTSTAPAAAGIAAVASGSITLGASSLASVIGGGSSSDQFAASANSNRPSTSPGGGLMGSQRPSSAFSRSTVLDDPDGLRAAFDSGNEVKWKELKVLGRGAYGVVAEAITSTGHICAVKHMVIPASNETRADLAQAEDMVEEIRLMKNLRHRNIVGYYGCQTKVMPDNGGRVVDVFMEACHGGSLNALRKKVDKQHGRLPVGLVRAYTRQILEGLAYLHMHQVIHRDLKSDNVLVSGDGTVRIGDFGTSRKLGRHSFEDTLVLEEQMSSGTNPGTGVGAGAPVMPEGGAMAKTLTGTPSHISPECLSESQDGYGYPTDIWSLGCTVLELFGHKPWKFQGASVFSIMFAIAQCKTLPTGMPDVCDAKLLSFLTGCFQRDPTQRPSARQLLEHPWITCPESELDEPTWHSDAADAEKAAAAEAQKQAAAAAAAVAPPAASTASFGFQQGGQ